jgi:hypothetical protein
MSHEHVTVTLDADTVERIAADLEEGETVSARVRALVEREYGDEEERALEFVDDCAV